jgi:hypothetical protein
MSEWNATLRSRKNDIRLLPPSAYQWPYISSTFANVQR